MSPFFKRGMKGDLVLVSTWMATVRGYLSNNQLDCDTVFQGSGNCNRIAGDNHQRLRRYLARVRVLL